MTTNNPLISVVLPVYNGECHLERSINSILKQDFQDFEFIIINDGSVDKTREIINSYSDSRIKYIENSSNQGIVRSLNRGLHLSKGKFIARMDSDDLSYPNRFSMQIKHMENYPEIDILSSCIYIKGLGALGKMLTDIDISILLLFCNPIFHPTVMMSLESLRKYKLYYDVNARYCEDYKLWIDSKMSGLNIHRCSDVLLDYSIGTERISHIKSSAQKYNSTILAYRYSCYHFPDFLKTKKQLFHKLLTGQRENDQDDYEINAFAKAFILENNRLKRFDELLFSMCVYSCLNS